MPHDYNFFPIYLACYAIGIINDQNSDQNILIIRSSIATGEYYFVSAYNNQNLTNSDAIFLGRFSLSIEHDQTVDIKFTKDLRLEIVENVRFYNGKITGTKDTVHTTENRTYEFISGSFIKN